jgi:CubicO group peptidase (beta-lactamase class C family)
MSKHSRRDVLKAAAAVTATASLGLGTGPVIAQSNRKIDAVLRKAVETREVAGVVAMAATDKGVLYQGTFGARALDAGPAMTPDSFFRIASMTKAITSVAAMQLVEQGKLTLDGPVPNIDPTIGAPQVLEGFDASGAPKLRAAKRPITLRQLLTHSAGFGYEQWHPAVARYVKVKALPSRGTGKLVTIQMPLVNDPGERWLYGINTDWVGRIVEATSGQPLQDYFRDKIFAPLGMKDSTYIPTDEQRSRQARLHTRSADGSLAVQPLETLPPSPEFWSGGGPLYSTGPDYLKFLQMLLHGGAFGGARLLKPETVALMNRNAVGDIPCGVLKSEAPAVSNDVDLFPGAQMRWGLGYMLNVNAGPNGRSAGTVGWGGLYNTYYWLDPSKKVTGLIMTQVLPFADQRVLKLFGQFEAGVYDSLKAA